MQACWASVEVSFSFAAPIAAIILIATAIFPDRESEK